MACEYCQRPFKHSAGFHISTGYSNDQYLHILWNDNSIGGVMIEYCPWCGRALDPQTIDSKLLYSKEAIFKLIAQFHHPNKFDDGEFYMYNLCESALELAFEVLGIEDDYIKLMDYCKMWEDNKRTIWAINNPNVPYNGVTADTIYEWFVEEYESWQRVIDYLAEED